MREGTDSSVDILDQLMSDLSSIDFGKGETISEKQKEDLSKLSSDELQKIAQKSIDDKNYLLANALKPFSEEKEKQESDEKNKEHEKDLKEKKEKEKKEKEDKIVELKNALEGKSMTKDKKKETIDMINSLSEELKGLEEDIKKLQEKNSSLLEDLKEAKKIGDSEEFKKLKKELEDLKKENKRMKDKYAGKIESYDGKVIPGLKKINKRWIKIKGEKSADGYNTTIERPHLSINKKIRSRARINKTVKMMNKIGNDSAKGVKYIMAKSSLMRGGKIGMGLKKLKNRLTIRNVDKFDKVFDQQKKKFIEDLKGKIETKGLTSNDKKTFELIEKRLDYYKQDFKRKMIAL